MKIKISVSSPLKLEKKKGYNFFYIFGTQEKNMKPKYFSHFFVAGGRREPQGKGKKNSVKLGNSPSYNSRGTKKVNTFLFYPKKEAKEEEKSFFVFFFIGFVAGGKEKKLGKTR